MRHNSKVNIFAGIVIVCVFLTGCDAVQSIKDKLTGADKAEMAQSGAQKTTPAGQKASIRKDVVAQVGAWSITKDEFRDRLNALKEVVPDFNIEDPEARAFVLTELTRQQLLVEDAQRSGLAKDKDILSAVEEFRRTLIVRETVRKLTETIEVSDEEAQQFYESRKELLVETEEWRVSEIVVDSQDQAKQILNDVSAGAEFAAAAREYSKSTTADKGGDLGFISQAPFQEMLDALVPLEVEDVSKVFQGPDGFYIVKLEEKRGGAQIKYKDVEAEIKANIQLTKQQSIIQKHLEDLEQKIGITVNADLLK